jgi:quinol monooxygenase YgiN
MIVVAARLKAIEGKGDEIEREFKKLLPIVLKEAGTVSYTVHRKMDSPNEFLVYEKYKDRDAFKFHMSTEYFKDFSKAIMPLLDGPADIGLYQELA